MIPKQWAWIKTGDICEIVGGSTPDTKDSSNFEKGDIAWITPADLSGYTDKYISKGARNITLKGLQNCSTKIVNPGTVLFSSRAPIGYVAIAAQALTTNQGFKSFVPPDDLSSDYLYYYLKFAKHLALDLASGTTFKEISGQKAALIPLPLPPLAEQHRIVAKLEELFSELDKGVENLRTAQQQLKVYRQAVLQWAFEGKLTEEWRRKQSSLTSAIDLVESIAKQRNKGAIILGKKEKYFPLLLHDMNDDFAPIPDSWTWAKIEQVSTCLDSKRVPINKQERQTRTGNIPYYGANGLVGFIDDYIFDEDLILVVEDETFVGREKPFSYKIKGKAWVNNHAHVLRSEINIDFLNYQLLYYPFLPLTTGTTGRKKLTQYALMNAPIKICTLPEQQQIVAEIESRLSVCDKLEETIEQSLLQAEALRQSILKKAFAGKLVPQDPSDEPAEKLLARIRAERAAATPDKIKSAKRKVK